MATATITASDDAYVSSLFPTTHYTNNYTIVRANGPSLTSWRNLIEFDFSSIPANATVNSAYLYIYQTTDERSVAVTLSIYKVTSAVDYDTVTWNTQPTYEATPTIASLSCPDSAIGVWRNWAITSLITEMISDGSTSIGMRLNSDPLLDLKKSFMSTNFSSLHPYLLVDYSLPVKVAATNGDADKVVHNMLMAATNGPINKTIAGMQENLGGTNWKTVF